MKRRIAAIVMTGVFSLASASAQNTQDVFRTSYEYDSGCLVVEGTSSLKYKEYVFTAIALKGEEPSENDLYNQIKVNDDGSFSDTVKINSVLNAGEYDIYINNSNIKTVRALFLPDSQKLGEVVSAINSGTDVKQILSDAETVRLLAMDGGFVKQNLSAISSYIARCKPSRGYDSAGFIKAYVSVLCGIGMKNSETDALLQRYADYVGINYETDYKSLSDAAKKQITVIANTDKIPFERPFGEYYDELSFMAQARSCTSYEKLMEYIEKNYAAAGLDMSGYNGISNKYMQQEVFRSLYREISGIYNFSGLRTKFEQLVKDSGGKKQTGGGGGSSGGTSPSGGVSVVGGGTAENGNAAEAADFFSDMNNHWAFNEIKYLQEKSIINGYDDNTFRPNKTVTRGEFVKMICSSCGHAAQYGGSDMFEDVKKDSWYFEVINTAAEQGIITGSDGKFMPESPITRQDAAVILHRMFKYKNISLTGQSSFDDENDIADYARESVSVLAANDIIKGYENRFSPSDNLTRAEAGVLIYRLVNYSA